VSSDSEPAQPGRKTQSDDDGDYTAHQNLIGKLIERTIGRCALGVKSWRRDNHLAERKALTPKASNVLITAQTP
jgi:hypothetical protein